MFEIKGQAMNKDRLNKAIETMVENFDASENITFYSNENESVYFFKYHRYWFRFAKTSEDYLLKVYLELSEDDWENVPQDAFTLHDFDNCQIGLKFISEISGRDLSLGPLHRLYGCFGFDDITDVIDDIILSDASIKQSIERQKKHPNLCNSESLDNGF